MHWQRTKKSQKLSTFLESQEWYSWIMLNQHALTQEIRSRPIQANEMILVYFRVGSSFGIIYMYVYTYIIL